MRFSYASTARCRLCGVDLQYPRFGAFPHTTPPRSVYAVDIVPFLGSLDIETLRIVSHELADS